MNVDAVQNNTANYWINNKNTTTSRSFEYKSKITESTPADNNTLDTEVVVPLKYLSNFLRSPDLLLINCYMELDLRWVMYWVRSEILSTVVVAAGPAISNTSATF